MIGPEDIRKYAEQLHEVWVQESATTTAGQVEVLMRNAAARYYYATFNRAAEIAKERANYEYVKGDKGHFELWDWFRKQGYPHILDDSNEIRGWRVKADYYLSDPVPFTLDQFKSRVKLLWEDLDLCDTELEELAFKRRNGLD